MVTGSVERDQYRVLSEQGRNMSRRSPRAGSRSPPPRMKRDRSRSRSPVGSPRRNNAGGHEGKKLRVYVRNLPYTTKWMELKDLMKKCGTVEHVEVFTDGEGHSKGCGVVEFATPEHASRAIAELDGKEFQGRQLRLREDIMDDETYKKQLQNLKEKSRTLKEQNSGGGDRLNVGGASAQPVGFEALIQRESAKQQMFNILTGKNADQINSTVFVSNLDYDISWQSLKDTFRRAGTCVRCDIQSDQDRKSKGFGTVVFETPFEALTAIALYNGMTMGNAGRQISCRLDRNAPLAMMMNSLGVEYNKFSLTQLVQLQAQALQAQTAGVGALAGLGGALSGSGMAGLSGLGAQAPASSGLAGLSALGQLLGAGGLSNQGIAPSLGSSGLGAGMSSSVPSSMMSSMPNDRRDSGRGRSSGGGGDRGVKTVFVRNLPFSVTWQQLKDRFRDVGNVARAEVQKDDQGRSKGHGTVEFETHADACRAVDQLSGTRMDGREIQVRLDRN